jgi:hypothetical protein
MFNTNSIPNTSPLYGRNDWRTMQQVNPQEVELMMKQKFNQPYFPNQQFYQQNYDGSSYLELQQVLSSCSPAIRQKIMSDRNYKECDSECEALIKQAIEEIIIPQVIMTPQGKVAFEKFAGTVKKLKEIYSQEEIEATQRLQALMQDEVVKQRLQELAKDQNNGYAAEVGVK